MASDILSNVSKTLSNFINWLKEDPRNIAKLSLYVIVFWVGGRLLIYLLRPIVSCQQCIIDLIAYLSIFFIISISLNLQYGYAGVPNFGMVLPVAAGAYVTGALAGRIAMWYYGPFRDPTTGQLVVDPITGDPLDFIDENNLVTSLIRKAMEDDLAGGIMIFFITAVVAILVAFALGYVASRPAIRLRADYLIIVLITMGEAIRIIGTNYPRLVGGTLWVSVPDIFQWIGDRSFNLSIGDRSTSIALRPLTYMILLFGIALLIFGLVQIMTSSPYGRVLKAVRENELTAETMGKDVVAIKTTTLMVGSGIAALAGVLWAFYMHVVIAADYIRVQYTFWPWLMIMIGGMGNNKGAAVGAAGVVVFRRLLIIHKHDVANNFNEIGTSAPGLYNQFTGILLIAILASIGLIIGLLIINSLFRWTQSKSEFIRRRTTSIDNLLRQTQTKFKLTSRRRTIALAFPVLVGVSSLYYIVMPITQRLRFLMLFGNFAFTLEIWIREYVNYLEQLVLGIALLLFIMFRPQGLLPEGPIKMRGINPAEYAAIAKHTRARNTGKD